MNKKVIDRIYIVIAYDYNIGNMLESFTDKDKAEAYVKQFMSIPRDYFARYSLAKHEIPVYPDDTWDSIRERGCKALCNDYYREKWESWCLNREIERMERE